MTESYTEPYVYQTGDRVRLNISGWEDIPEGSLGIVTDADAWESSQAEAVRAGMIPPGIIITRPPITVLRVHWESQPAEWPVEGGFVTTEEVELA